MIDIQNELKNLIYKEENIGATIKQSKKYFQWGFDYKYESYKLEMYDSKLSGKKRIHYQGNLIKQVEDPINSFTHSLKIADLACIIIQYGDKYELRIENQSFTHLHELQKE